MENATKALLIAAGMLFAVIIATIAFVAFRNISGYYQAKQISLTEQQLSDFNVEYGAYERDLTGFELVGLINKIADFNQRNPEEEGYEVMTINVKINTSDYDGLFNVGNEYKYTGKNGDKDLLISQIKAMQKLEKEYTAQVLSRLVANSDYETMTKEEIEKIIRKTISNETTFRNNLNQYEAYIAFKRGKFSYVKNEYKYGQIVSLSYEGN